jgi:hypothetical protein
VKIRGEKEKNVVRESTRMGTNIIPAHRWNNNIIHLWVESIFSWRQPGSSFSLRDLPSETHEVSCAAGFHQGKRKEN